MNQTAQHISPNPAQRLADKILARTNNGQDLIDLLHDIGKGRYDANKNDRITASNYLFDRGYGKCPRQSPAANPDQEHPPATDDNDVAALREAPSAVPHTEAESPRLVTQIDDALNESFGPAPSAHTHPPVIPPASLTRTLLRIKTPTSLIPQRHQNLSTPLLSKPTLLRSPTTATPSSIPSWR